MAEVILKNVTKRYGKTEAVHGISLDIHDLEFVVFVGPSGCGKSTTLRMIAGLEQISGGEIYIGDRIVNNVAPKDRDVAMVFQNYALYPHMNVFNNMAFGLKLRKIPKAEIEKQVHEAAGILGLTELLKRKPFDVITSYSIHYTKLYDFLAYPFFFHIVFHKGIPVSGNNLVHQILDPGNLIIVSPDKKGIAPTVIRPRKIKKTHPLFCDFHTCDAIQHPHPQAGHYLGPVGP